MKKRAKSLSALLLAFMLLALAGCGGPSELVGTWTAEVDCTDEVTQVSEEVENARDYFSAFYLKLTVVFHEDGTYECEFDQDALAEELNQFKTELGTFMDDYLWDLVVEILREAGVTADLSTVESVDAVVQEIYGMSYDEMLTASLGMELSAYVDASLDLDALLNEFEGLNTQGNYKAANGKLYMSDTLEHTIDPKIYETYTLEGNVLTLTGYVGDDEGSFEGNYPLVFTKVD